MSMTRNSGRHTLSHPPEESGDITPHILPQRPTPPSGRKVPRPFGLIPFFGGLFQNAERFF